MPDGTLLIADEGGGLQRVGRFPADRGVRIDAGRGAVTAIVPSPDGRWVALTCKRGASIREGATLNELGFVSIKHSARLAFRSDGTLLALSGVSEGGDCPRRLTAWRVGPQGVGAARTVPTPCAVVCLSGDGRFMLGQVPRSSPEALTVWALDASIRAVRVSRLVTDARNGHFGTLFLSGDGHHLVSLDAPLNPYPESYPRLYDTRKGKLLRLFDSNAGVSGGLAAIAPKATLLVTSGYFPDPVCYWVFGYRPHRDAVVWEATGFGRPSEGAAESAPDPSTAPIRSLDVSADGERVAVVTSLGVFVLDAGTGKLVWQPR